MHENMKELYILNIYSQKSQIFLLIKYYILNNEKNELDNYI